MYTRLFLSLRLAHEEQGPSVGQEDCWSDSQFFHQHRAAAAAAATAAAASAVAGGALEGVCSSSCCGLALGARLGSARLARWVGPDGQIGTLGVTESPLLVEAAAARAAGWLAG